MEHLQQYIKDRFNTLKWDKDPDKDLWSTKQEITVNQGTMFINGQQIKQEGQKKTIGKSFSSASSNISAISAGFIVTRMSRRVAYFLSSTIVRIAFSKSSKRSFIRCFLLKS